MAAASQARPVEESRIGWVFHALADPTRRAVVQRLSSGPASTTELARPFRMALPSFAQHLDVLEKAGMVESRKEGRLRLYRLVPTPLQDAEDWMVEQRSIWEQRLDRLEAYVEGTKTTDG
ncbi:MAG TPA: metalloregulator ArsR/SmtB family transcription factor [Allosphingosinicella sp.]|jgi:DNA-binding transcriptional ArsR family regulator